MPAQPVALVSKRIAALEARLGQRLLNRNTRELFVTEAGQRLYEHCLRAISRITRPTTIPNSRAGAD
jgi:DNA-binding transcriptional LysR family regulator